MCNTFSFIKSITFNLIITVIPVFGIQSSLQAMNGNNDSQKISDKLIKTKKISSARKKRICPYCHKSTAGSLIKFQNHLNSCSGNKTFICRRQGCSNLFSNDTCRMNHEYSCVFNSEGTIDKSAEKIDNAITIVEGEIIDARQFNALSNSQKNECPICGNSIAPKSYNRHVESCKKKSAANFSTAIKLKRCLKCKKIFQLSRFANHVCSDDFPNPHNDNSNKKNITNSMQQAVLPFVCAICKIAMGDKYDFLEHLEKCNPQQMYCCSNKQCFFRTVTEKDFLQQKEARQKAVTMMSNNSLEEPINSLAFNGLSPYETNQLDAEQDPIKLKRKPDGEPDFNDREQAKRLKINGGNLDE